MEQQQFGVRQMNTIQETKIMTSFCSCSRSITSNRHYYNLRYSKGFQQHPITSIHYIMRKANKFYGWLGDVTKSKSKSHDYIQFKTFYIFQIQDFITTRNRYIPTLHFVCFEQPLLYGRYGDATEDAVDWIDVVDSRWNSRKTTNFVQLTQFKFFHTLKVLFGNKKFFLLDDHPCLCQQ